MKESKDKKRIATLEDVLTDLISASERVSDKYGHDDDDIPSDWKEWEALRKAVRNAKSK